MGPFEKCNLGKFRPSGYFKQFVTIEKFPSSVPFIPNYLIYLKVKSIVKRSDYWQRMFLISQVIDNRKDALGTFVYNESRNFVQITCYNSGKLYTSFMYFCLFGSIMKLLPVFRLFVAVYVVQNFNVVILPEEIFPNFSHQILSHVIFSSNFASRMKQSRHVTVHI